MDVSVSLGSSSNYCRVICRSARYLHAKLAPVLDKLAAEGRVKDLRVSRNWGARHRQLHAPLRDHVKEALWESEKGGGREEFRVAAWLGSQHVGHMEEQCREK